ncbi:OPT/YSL family transporter [Kineosporia sp. J2-2]|uniref:OPT/YSL family transporter n=1 Tax=Kineosporia corallincola TaxID=2835133 RepID=A0ABS5TLP5_9ACTN|nr:OPT/YSL family transporter [Kineosporia corallincola]MBT0772012.1 OPT/YSL family transporter [Kineosporia corallincola]
MSVDATTGTSPGVPAQAEHPRALEPLTLVVLAILSVLGAMIGLHMITTLGISPNTSVIGALVAMLVGRVAFMGLVRFRSIHRQNLAQTAISSATFGAANSLITPIAIPWATGRTDLVWPMLCGALMGLAIDVWVLYRSYGSSFLPAHGAWPSGVAAAETIKAGDSGGKQAALLGAGGVAGFALNFFGLPMSAAGVALIGNMWALLMFGIGLLINQYYPNFSDGGVTLSSQYIPHGVMIGAGLVALVQAGFLLAGRSSSAKGAPAPQALDENDPSLAPTVTVEALRRTFSIGYGLYVAGAIVLATATGIWGDMSVPAMIGWVLFAAFAAIVHELIVGLAAMHSGWFPAFAVTLIFLIFGLLLHIPTEPLIVLVGYCAATGPAFADMGYDFKAGWLLRREHRPYTAFELEGRRQQLLGGVIGFVVAAAMVALLWRSYFEAGDVPPVSTVYATSIVDGLTKPHMITTLALWAIPGALIQLIGGPKRQMGVLLATGLLVSSPNAGWLVLAALAVRVVWERTRGDQGENEMALVGAGLIAGDSIYSAGQILK